MIMWRSCRRRMRQTTNTSSLGAGSNRRHDALGALHDQDGQTQLGQLGDLCTSWPCPWLVIAITSPEEVADWHWEETEVAVSVNDPAALITNLTPG